MSIEFFDGLSVGLVVGCLLTMVIYQLALWLDEKAKAEAEKRGSQDARRMGSGL